MFPTGEKNEKVLLSGFEPESSPRKGDMIGRSTLQEHYIVQVAPSGFEPLSLAPKASMIDHYTTGLNLSVGVMVGITNSLYSVLVI
jgi:hypothetical protein